MINVVNLVELCPLCSRPLGELAISQHHLVPKSKGGQDQDWVHNICHRKIHATLTNKSLEKNYDTWEKLQTHPDIITFIQWVSKKDPGYYSGSSNTVKRKR